jgi:hypothetical protein
MRGASMVFILFSETKRAGLHQNPACSAYSRMLLEACFQCREPLKLRGKDLLIQCLKALTSLFKGDLRCEKQPPNTFSTALPGSGSYLRLV